MGSKGSSVKIDTRPLADASMYASQISDQLGREQIAEAKRQYDLNMTVARPIIDAQTGLMNQAITQGNDYYDYSKSTFRPIEQSLANDALYGSDPYTDVLVPTATGDNAAAVAAASAQNVRNQSVKANIESEASRAGADVQRGLANMQGQNARAMRSMGVNPNSGRFAAMKVGEGLQGAAMKAAAQTNSRQKGVQLDYAKRLDSAGLSRGLTGASQGAYGLALNSGNSAVANQMQPSGQLLSGMQAGAGTINQGNQTMVQGLGTALNAQTQAAIANAQSSGSDGLGTLIGAGLGMWAGRG